MKRVFLLLGMLLVCLALLSGCIYCKSPLIRSGDQCCIDENGNGICDSAETLTRPTPEPSVSASPVATATEVAKELPDWQSIGDKMDTLYRSTALVFRPYDRNKNLTEFETRYDVYAPSVKKFFIYQIKDESDYINNDEDFAAFVSQEHEINVIAEEEANKLKLKDLQESSLNNVDAYYNSSYIIYDRKVAGEKVIFEKGWALFNTQFGYAISGRYIYNAYALCSPNIVVKIVADQKIRFTWSTLSEELALQNMLTQLDTLEPDLVSDTGRVAEACRQ